MFKLISLSTQATQAKQNRLDPSRDNGNMTEVIVRTKL